jgi:branched-chain amino acid transport system substrate-binding protein
MMQSVRFTATRGIAVLALVGLVAAGCSSSSRSSTKTTSPPSTVGSTPATTSSSGSSSGAATGTPIKIGFVTSVTGNASSTFNNSDIGAKAYFDAINKQGGFNGHPLQLITKDDASTPAGAASAVQLLDSEGVFAIISDSPYFFGAYRIAQKAGVPVLGSGFDGPEWGQQPNTNMISFQGGVDPTHPELQAALASTALMKYLGVKNVGALAYGISPSSTSSIKDLKTELQNQGIKMGYENLSVAFGTTDVGPDLLAMKSATIDMAVCSCVQSTVLSMVGGLKQSGLNVKSLSFASADSTLFAQPTAAAAAQGVYYSSIIPPVDTSNPASITFENRFKAADPSYQMGSYPTFGATDAYISAALVLKGLQVAGANPTHQSFISGLSQVSNWDGEGLLAAPVSFNHFGTSEKTYCEFYVHVQGQQFVSVNGGKPFCNSVPSNL